MSKKAAILRHLNMRAIKAGFYSTICRVPALRDYLNYYQEAESIESAAEPGSFQVLRISPARDYGISYTPGERDDIMQCDQATLDAMLVTLKMGRVNNVAVLGSSGVTVRESSGKVLSVGKGEGQVHRNQVIARPLAMMPGDENMTYINALWIHRGHRHFAHFFMDTLIPIIAYLKHWRDPDEKIVLLVREDLSAVQRDAYRFIEADYPGVTAQTLPSNCKINCRKSIFLAYENRTHGRDNVLVQEYLLEVRDMFLRHYELLSATPEKKKRLYLLRGKVPLRLIRNEKEVLRMLARYGVEPHDPGSLSFPDQARLFSGAGLVVSPHGSAMMNLMFSDSGTKVLEIFPGNYLDDSFIKVAKAMRQHYSYFLAGKGGMLKMSFTVDVAALEKALVALLDA